MSKSITLGERITQQLIELEKQALKNMSRKVKKNVYDAFWDEFSQIYHRDRHGSGNQKKHFVQLRDLTNALILDMWEREHDLDHLDDA